MEETEKSEQKNEETKVASAEDIRELVQVVRSRVLGKDDGKATVSDFIRLIQLYREVEDEDPSEVRVRWVDEQSSIEK